MWLFEKLFSSRGKGGRAQTPEKAIQRLRETEKMLAKKQESLQEKIEQESLTVRKNGTKNKRAALQALKRKQRYEKQLGQIDGTLWTIELQREELENADIKPQVLKNMGIAAQAMKAAHKNMDLDKVYDLMAEITEQQEVAQEISDVISKPIGFGEEYDEESNADVQGSDATVTELQKKLNVVLEKNKQLLENDQRREAYLWEILDRMLWLEKQLKEANWTCSQPHSDNHSDERSKIRKMTEYNEGRLQRASELEMMKEQVHMTQKALTETQIECKEKLKKVEELEQQLQFEMNSRKPAHFSDNEAQQLKGEAEDLQAQLNMEKRRSAALELQITLLEKFMINHHEKIQENIGALEREIKILSQDLQDEKQNCSYLKKQLFRVLKKRQNKEKARTTRSSDQADHQGHCSCVAALRRNQPSRNTLPPSPHRNLLDERVLECPGCRSEYPVGHFNDLLDHIDQCLD